MKNLLCKVKKAIVAKNERDIDLSHPEKLAVILASLTYRSDEHFFVVTPDRNHYSSLVVDLQTYFALAKIEREVLIFPEVIPALSKLAKPDYSLVNAFLANISNQKKPSIILLTYQDYTRLYPKPNCFADKCFEISLQSKFYLGLLRQKLIDYNYACEEQVEGIGEFASRGGILDIFSPLYSQPFRVEFWGDEVESIRRFDVVSQCSNKQVGKFDVIAYNIDEQEVSLQEYLPQAKVIDVCLEQRLDGASYKLCFARSTNQDKLVALAPLYASSFCEIKASYGQVQRKLLFSQLQRWLEADYDLTIFCNHQSRSQRLQKILEEETDLEVGKIKFENHTLNNGFMLQGEKIIVLSEDEIFGRGQVRKKETAQEEKKGVSFSFGQDLEEGQYAVHATYGICLYHGVKLIEKSDEQKECLILEFADKKKIYLSLAQAYLVTSYKGSKKVLPKLSSLNSKVWSRTKDKVSKAVKDVAAEFLRLQAIRQTSKGYAYLLDSEWEEAFAQSFAFVETPDQLQAIQDVKSDMAKEQPMDRLLCGDVGFGKTEVAMRASLTAVMNGKQVAIIVPTTVLSQQHFMNFSKRMADFPINIAILNRFVAPATQREILESLMLGKIDIIIGTHRLVQKDVVFADLGLLVIDEEQKFGVETKNVLKKFKLSVDVLSMTATPIPRTLYHSLAGIRDLSTITTAPKERKAVKSIVTKYDEETIIKAIKYEISRGGQVYFLHNRVASIDKVFQRLKVILPSCVRLAIGHGQMEKDHLEEVMANFFEHKIDVLLCTTIIESGLDVANANTIIVDRADNFGLSSLYQLRGRVGRDINQAYAYFLISDESVISGDAMKRLHAINHYTQLGSGLKLALRDLEIRGAGNLLGVEQSGHIAQVGFELYCQLLKQEVSNIKSGKKQVLFSTLDVKLDFISTGLKSCEKAPACFPPSYISNIQHRISFYKNLYRLESFEKLNEFSKQLKDRFGSFPDEVTNLFLFTRVKINMLNNHYQTLHTRGQLILLKDIEGRLVREQFVGQDTEAKFHQLIKLTSQT